MDEVGATRLSPSQATSLLDSPGKLSRTSRETLKLISDVEYDSLFIFKYSKRPNTAALEYEDHIPEEEKTR